MLTLTDIYKGYDKRQLIRGFSLTVASGEMIAITGESGKGKTTLLNVMSLLDTADTGAIHYQGRDISKLSTKQKEQLYRNDFGFLFQNYALIEQQTVSRNLDVPLFKFTKKKRNLLKRAALDEVGLTQQYDTKVYALSGGEQQRVALARLLFQEPTLVFADEPTEALDEKISNVS